MRYGYGIVDGNTPQGYMFTRVEEAQDDCGLHNRGNGLLRVVELHYDIPDVAALAARVEAAGKALREIQEEAALHIGLSWDGYASAAKGCAVIFDMCDKALEGKV